MKTKIFKSTYFEEHLWITASYSDKNGFEASKPDV